MKKLLAVLFVSVFALVSCDSGSSSSGASSSGTTSSSSSSSSAASSGGGGPDPWLLTGALDTSDPSIIKEGETWYIFGSGEGGPVKRSADGYNWSDMGRVFDAIPAWADDSVPNHDDTILAPDIKHHNGKYYLYYSISSSGENDSAIGLATSSSLSAPDWQDQGLVIRSTASSNYNCLHPNLVVDQSGGVWLAFGSSRSGLKIVKLNSTTMKPKSGAIVRSLATRNNKAIESPYLVVNTFGYYLFATIDNSSQGVDGTAKIIYGRASRITGPYYDKDGVSMLRGGGSLLDDGDDRWRAPGGQSFLDYYFMAHHAYDAENGGAATLRIRNIHWMGTEGQSTWPQYP